MAVTINLTVEDVTARLLTYDRIELERATTVDGSYSNITDILLVSGTFYYSFEDSGGDLNKWYRYRFRNDVGPVNSDYSDPFRVEGVSRLRARQRALSEYDAGIVLVNTGTDSNKITTADYRFNSSLFRADKGKGSWLLPTSGNNDGVARIISASDPTNGTLTVLPAWSGAFVNDDTVEWHWLANPTVWDDAINRGLVRYWFVDKIPIAGVADQDEYDLSGVPWLFDANGQIHDVRHYPNRTSAGVDDGIDESWGVKGRWWGIQQDREKTLLAIKPTIASTEVLYLEATRPMPRIYTDTSALPLIAAEELVAALAYDEVLAYLGRPGRGSADDRSAWRATRAAHASELHRLLVKHRPKPRFAPHRMPFPTVVPQPWTAR